MTDKYLWQPRRSADDLAITLTESIQTAEPTPESVSNLSANLKAATDMILKQQEHIGGLMNYLLSNMAPGRAVEILITAGIDRHELVSCWGVSKEMAIEAEETVERKKQALLQPR